MTSPTRIALVGAGHMGRLHLRKILELCTSGQVSLDAIADTDPQLREQISREHGCPAVATIEQLPDTIQGVVIASPTHTHTDLSLKALRRGFDVLVEKPMAPDPAAARQMVREAKRLKRILQVGFVERFNPAVRAALKIADRPRYIVSERLAPFTGRSTDVDVILDLMIHDLDVVTLLIPHPLQEIRALGVPMFTHEIDMATARLAFEDGSVAQLSAGRASLSASRKIRLFTLERYLSVDCQLQEVRSIRREAAKLDEQWPTLSGEPVSVDKGDALSCQLQNFIDCINTRQTPEVDGSHALRTLELAFAIKQATRIPLPDA
jgi:predicted dehydrogenase